MAGDQECEEFQTSSHGISAIEKRLAGKIGQSNGEKICVFSPISFRLRDRETNCFF
jgi:hypothetical protein